jgi:hypothetical protein
MKRGNIAAALLPAATALMTLVACCKSKKGNNQGQAVPQEKESLPPT